MWCYYMWRWLSMCCLCAANAVHLRGGVCALPTPCIRALPRKPYAGPPGGNIYYRFWTPELYYLSVVIITPMRLLTLLAATAIVAQISGDNRDASG